MRRVMRESYSMKTTKDLKHFVRHWSGGYRRRWRSMGRLFEKMLTLSGYQVRILEQHDWDRAADIVADAGMVIVSVPIHVLAAWQITAFTERLSAGRSGIVKNGPLQAMLAAHDGPVLGLRPMLVRTAVAWQSKLWSGVMDVNRKHTNGFWSKFRSGRSAASY